MYVSTVAATEKLVETSVHAKNDPPWIYYKTMSQNIIPTYKLLQQDVI